MATFTKFQFNFERGLVISFNPKKEAKQLIAWLKNA